MVRAEVQPCSGAPIRAQTRETAPTVALAAPTRSKRPGRRGVSSTNRPTRSEHDEAERHVDEERPAPRADVGEQAAEDEADGGAARGDGAEEGEGAVAGGVVGSARGEQGQHARGGERRADALQGAGGDELTGRLGEPAERGGDGEDRQPDLEGTQAPEDVSEPAAEEQQPAEGEGVGVEHPRQGGRAEAEVGVDAGEGDVHDGGVEHDHQLRDQHDRDAGGGAAGLRRELDGEAPGESEGIPAAAGRWSMT